jgi:uncharacterized protein (TIGR02757 family)
LNKQLTKVKQELDQFLKYNYNDSFVKEDPLSIPHRFTFKQDIEISAFFAAVFAWGQRVTIINKTTELLNLMDNSPYQFIMQHQDNDLKKMSHFKHRTFNYTDLLYFIDFLKRHYHQYSSLEEAFIIGQKSKNINIEKSLIQFENYFFNMDYAPDRTRKHIATPARNSTCKRLNMFLRWMVRKDDQNIDLGIWNKISPAHLLCPLDVHVERVARHFKLISRTQNDWQTVLELSKNLVILDAKDPIKYDFALFGLGVQKKALFI